MKRRKDNKGKVLKEGESQRKDGRYQYRITTITGKRITVYSDNLKELRKKEQDLLVKVALKKNLNGTTTTVYELTEKYFTIHEESWKKGTLRNHRRYLKALSEFEFGQRKISDVRYSDALLWAKELYTSGYSFGMVNSMLSLVRPSFNLACKENLIDSNPFSFNLSEVAVHPENEKYALTSAEYNSLIDFIKSSKSKVYRKRLNEIIILYETGIRVSELCGLTLKDVDLENGRVSITHQLQWSFDEKYYIETPKSKSGNRVIPLSPIAKECFKEVIANRPSLKIEPMVDGYVGFLFLTNRGNPQMEKHVNQHLQTVVNNFNETHEEKLPHITPHTFRHTFCSRMITSGMDVKSVQYLMGHATAQMTLEVYSHVMREEGIEEFFKAAT